MCTMCCMPYATCRSNLAACPTLQPGRSPTAHCLPHSGLRTICGNQLLYVGNPHDFVGTWHPLYTAYYGPRGTPACITPTGWGLAITRTATRNLKIHSRHVGTSPMEVGPRTHSETDRENHGSCRLRGQNEPCAGSGESIWIRHTIAPPDRALVP